MDIRQNLKKTVSIQSDRELKEECVFFVSFLLIVIATVLLITSVFPACFPDDSVNILNDIYHHNRWRDWHPVTYYLFLRICMSVYHNPFSVILVHCAIMLLAHLLVLRYLFRYHGICSCIIYTFLTLTLGLASYEYLIILYKDTPFAIGVLGFTVSLLYGIREEWTRKNLINIVYWGIFASLMRHGGWVAMSGGLCLCALVYLIKRDRIVAVRIGVSTLAICLLFNIVRGSLIRLYNVDKNPGYVSYTIPLYMLGSYTEHEGELDDRITSVMEELAPIEYWNTRYNVDRYFADPIARDGDIVWGVDNEGMHFRLIEANALYFIEKPMEYLHNFFMINNVVWCPITRGNGNYVATMPSLRSELYIREQFPEWDTKIWGCGYFIQMLFDKIKMIPWMRDAVYRGGLGLITILVFIIRNLIKKNEYYLAFIPVMISIAMLMISVPQQNTRYVLPQIMVGCLALSLLISREKGKGAKNAF